MGAVVDIVGGWIGGEKAAEGEESARKAYDKALQQQLSLYRDIYTQQRADQLPWLQQGSQAANLLGQFYGFTPSTVPTATAFAPAPGAPGSGATPQAPAQGGMMQGNQQGTIANILAQRFGSQNPTAEVDRGEFMQSAMQTQAAQPAQTTATPQPVGTSAPAPATGGAAQSPTQMQDAAMQRFFTSPDYQFRLGEGNKNILANAAATGGLQSGDTLKALNRYGSNLASGEFGDYWNRLAGLAGVGQTSAQSVGQAGSNFASGSSGALGQNAANRGSSYQNSGQIWGNTAGGIAGSLQSASNTIGNLLGGF